MPATHELATPRLRLAPLGPSDLEGCFALDQDPEVMRYITGRTTPWEEFEREVWPRLIASTPSAPSFYGAHERAESGDQFVGWFHLRPSVRLAGELEVGYRLARAAWGRGLATEGTRALVRHAFETRARDLVDACVHPENTASRRVLERCGFEPRGTFRHPRAPIDVVHYVLDRARYDASRLGVPALREHMERHYTALHDLARAALRGHNDDQSIDPSELVHDCYLKLARGSSATPVRRTEFLALASSVVRSVLVDRARELYTSKRGGDRRRVTFHGDLFHVQAEIDVLALDEALQVLAALDERQARVVELKFFGRLTIDEIATLLGCSARTVNHDWAHARAWLHRELSP